MGALSGIRVLDLSFFAPGRWGTMIMGDLGADVVCVEVPRGVRSKNELLESDTHVRWLKYRRNKRSITLNLKTEGGRDVFRRLAAKADVIIESYKPGTAKNLGVDYETVRAINPDIVYCSVSGFGQTGPYSQLIGHEPNYQGLSGVLFQNRPDGGEPQVLPALVGDLAGGAVNALIGILAALLHKTKTGQGQYVDVSIVAGIVHFTGIFPYASWGEDPYRMVSNTSGLRADFRAYRTKDGRYVAISPSEPAQFKRFLSLVGRDDLYDLRETDTRRRELAGALSDLFLTRTQAEWVEFNQRENIAVTAVLETMKEIENDPQMVHRGLFQELDYEPMGKVKQISTPFLMSETPPEIRFMPRFGEHTGEILTELGYPPGSHEELREAGATE